MEEPRDHGKNRSPKIDALAADGLKLNRHYVFKYCSPTRSSMISGRLPLHVNQNTECNLVASGRVLTYE